MNTENEIYSLATCPGTKYSGDTITLRATPRNGIGPYYVAFKKDGIIIDPSRLGGQLNPIMPVWIRVQSQLNALLQYVTLL